MAAAAAKVKRLPADAAAIGNSGQTAYRIGE
jgi:hypothetical protein